MNDDGVVDGIVTKFLLNSCRLCPQLTDYGLQAVVCCAALASNHHEADENVEYIPLITGSVAEFYVEPMLPHVGDIDIMCYDSKTLVIPRGHPPLTRLPAEFDDYVHLHEIIDSHLPGYVYIKLQYLLTKCTESDIYNAIEYEESECRSYTCL